MIQLFENDGNWLLVKGLKTSQSEGITGLIDGSDRFYTTYDDCWTGEGWAHQNYFAKKFSSREEAQTYFNQHISQMIDTI